MTEAHQERCATAAVAQDESPPLDGLRATLEARLRDGTALTPHEAAACPDLVQLDAAAAAALPGWLRTLLRRPAREHGPRYVWAAGAPFHVFPTGGGMLVSRVDYFEAPGIRKPVHNPFTVTVDERRAALDVYQRVTRFLATPQAFTNEWQTAMPAADSAAAAPVSTRSRRRGHAASA